MHSSWPHSGLTLRIRSNPARRPRFPSLSILFSMVLRFSFLWYFDSIVYGTPRGRTRGRRRGPSAYTNALARGIHGRRFPPSTPDRPGIRFYRRSRRHRECRGRPGSRPRQTDRRRRIRRLLSVTAASRAPPIYKKHISLTIGACGSCLSTHTPPPHPGDVSKYYLLTTYLLTR